MLQPVVRDEISSWMRVTRLWSIAKADLSLSVVLVGAWASPGLCTLVAVALEVVEEDWHWSSLRSAWMLVLRMRVEPSKAGTGGCEWEWDWDWKEIGRFWEL